MNLRLIIQVAILICNFLNLQSQTLYIPNGTNGIGTSYNGNIGIGINQPTEKFSIDGNLKTSGIIYSTADGYAQTFLRSWGLNGNGTIYIEPQASYDLYLTDSWSRTGMLNIQFGKTVFESGDVGIGITNPTSRLSVNGDIYINSGKDDNHIYWGDHFMTLGTKPGDYSHNVLNLKPGGALQGKLNSVFNLYNANSQSSFELKVQICSDGVTFFNGGNVGIGIPNPQNLLDVNGTIRAKEIKVETGWADFVFHPSYQLKPLTEVEKFIKTNGHLEDIPSAAEVEQNGVNVGEMQKMLLQKVEELTLYIIEKDKELSRLNQIITKQQENINALREEIKAK